MKKKKKKKKKLSQTPSVFQDGKDSDSKVKWQSSKHDK
jgi:hypothetical protein